MNRYSILAPNALPSSGFVEAKEATSKILAGIQLEEDKYKLGHTKVFFRAGVLGALEDIREERVVRYLVSSASSHPWVPDEKELHKAAGSEVTLSTGDCV